jgi:hypothetical protein
MLSALLLVLIAAPNEVSVRVDAAPGAEVACRLEDAAATPAPGRLAPQQGRWEWRLLPGDRLHCAGPGHEPAEIDASRGVPPRDATLALLPARPVTIEAGWPGVATEVEWRELARGASVLRAQQRMALAGTAVLPVATSARVIRLRPKGMSPISLFVPQGTSPLTLRVSAPRAGGEVFGTLPGTFPAPEALLLDHGSTRRVLQVQSGIFGAAGLPPGPYTLTPRYRGGLLGDPFPLRVVPEDTVELLPLPLPVRGAVSLRAAPELCGGRQLPASLVVRRVRDEGRSVDAKPTFEETLAEPPCERELEGLEPGTYQAELARAWEGRETISSVRFAVRGAKRAEALLATAAVRVTGRVRFSADRPATGVILAFELDQQSWTAETDGNGEYIATLGRPGAYLVSVRASRGLPSASQVRELVAGEQTLDLDLPQTLLDVHVVSQQPAALEESVELTITSSRGTRLTGSFRPDQEGSARFVGLELDEYWVTARTASGLSSVSSARVSLSAELPTADVELVLGRHAGRLELLDERGVRVPGARVEAGARLLAEAAPGVFPLDRIPVGEWLRIDATGYVPVCHVLQRPELPELRVTLQKPLERVQLHFAAQVAWEAGQIVGIPGSDCPVEIGALGLVTSLGEERTTVLLRVPRGSYRLVIGSAALPLVAPGPDVDVPSLPSLPPTH